MSVFPEVVHQFKVGDPVCIIDTGEVGRISFRGSRSNKNADGEWWAVPSYGVAFDALSMYFTVNGAPANGRTCDESRLGSYEGDLDWEPYQ